MGSLEKKHINYDRSLEAPKISKKYVVSILSQIQSLDFYDPILEVLKFTTCPAAGQPNQLLVLLRIQHQPFPKEHAARDRERKGSL